MTATNEGRRETLLAMLADYLDTPVAELKPDVLLADLGADSLDYVQLAFEIEDKFGITLEGDGAELRQQLRTIGDVLRVTEEILAQKASSSDDRVRE